MVSFLYKVSSSSLAENKQHVSVGYTLLGRHACKTKMQELEIIHINPLQVTRYSLRSYNTLARHQASLNFPIMHLFHAICTHSVTNIT